MVGGRWIWNILTPKIRLGNAGNSSDCAAGTSYSSASGILAGILDEVM